MRRIQRIRPTGAAAVVGVAISAAVLAGCGAGQITQTDTQVSGIGGANVNVKAIAVRNAQFILQPGTKGAVAYVRGGSAPLEMVIVNTGGTPDTLVSASSPLASSVDIQGSKDVQAGRVLNVQGGGSSASTTSSPASGSATPSGAPTSTSAATPTPLPTNQPGGSTNASIVLQGLKEDIASGKSYNVVLTFQNAGQVTVPVPVAVSSSEREDPKPGE